jgi:hypothetical protein
MIPRQHPEQSHGGEILATLNRGAASLDAAARENISEGIRRGLSATGGFVDRAGKPDIYYSVFGLSCSVALSLSLPWGSTLELVQNWPKSGLSLVDLSSLVRCQTILGQLSHLGQLGQLGHPLPDQNHTAFFAREVERFRSDDGGYSFDGAKPGFPSAAFLAMNLYQDLRASIPDSSRLIHALQKTGKPDGSFAHPAGSRTGVLSSTAAGLLTLRQVAGAVHEPACRWLASQVTSCGGFKAHSGADLPDVLSTAVALFSLQVCGHDMTSFRLPAQRFIEDHWLDDGSFAATLLDETGDCEYTFYGLLALGAIAHV